MNVEKFQGKLINVPADEEQLLGKFHKKHQYLLINKDVDINSDISNFKLWSERQYNELIGMIKERFSKLSLVRVGFRTGKDKMMGLDVDLTGKTSLDELLVLLKTPNCLLVVRAAWHILIIFRESDQLLFMDLQMKNILDIKKILFAPIVSYAIWLVDTFQKIHLVR